jgi:hypothetical protein
MCFLPWPNPRVFGPGENQRKSNIYAFRRREPEAPAHCLRRGIHAINRCMAWVKKARFNPRPLAAGLLGLFLLGQPLSASPDGGPDPDKLLKFTRIRTASALDVAWTPSENAPWATVQMHVSLHGMRLSAQEEAALYEFARRLALGRRRGMTSNGVAAKIQKMGGNTRLIMHLDGFAISDGIPVEQLGPALRAMKERLSLRRNLARLGEEDESLVQVHHKDAAISTVARQILAPGHPYARIEAWPNKPENPARKNAKKAVERVQDTEIDEVAKTLMVRGGTAISVVGGADNPANRGTITRTFTVTLPRQERLVDGVPPISGRLRVVEGSFPGENGFSRQWLFPGPGWGQGPADALKTQAARAVLAELVGAQVVERAALSFFALDDRDAPKRKNEAALLERLQTIAKNPPSKKSVNDAAQRVGARRLKGLTDSEDLAFHLGIGILFADDPGLFEDQVRLIEKVEPSQVQKAAQAILKGPRALVKNNP